MVICSVQLHRGTQCALTLLAALQIRTDRKEICYEGKCVQDIGCWDTKIHSKFILIEASIFFHYVLIVNKQ